MGSEYEKQMLLRFGCRDFPEIANSIFGLILKALRNELNTEPCLAGDAMTLYIGLRYGLLASALVLGTPANGAASICPSTIYPDFCEQLQTGNDTDWLYYSISLRTPPDWGGPVCNKIEDSTCLGRPVDTSWFTLPPYIYEDTRTLFETYDLRWPEDLQTRASVPTESGSRDTVSYQYHRPYLAYIVYATKRTLLSISAEPYVQEMWPWSVRQPLSLSPSKSPVPMRARASSFNLKGQRIEADKAQGFKPRR